MRPLIALLPRDLWIALPVDECPDILEDFATAVADGMSRLVVPRAAVPPDLLEDAEQVRLDPPEAAALMAALAARMATLQRAGRMNEFNMQSRVTLAARVVERARGDRRSALGGAAAFFARDAARNARVPVSWNDLIRAREESRLFLTQSVSSRAVDVDLLQQALLTGGADASDSVLTLQGGAVTEVLFDDRERPRAFGAPGIVSLLSRRPALAPPAERVGLLDYLLRHGRPLDPTQRDAGLVGAIRYLLHGRADSYGDADSPLFVPQRDNNRPVCEALVLS
jgi:hypothetical protein